MMPSAVVSVILIAAVLLAAALAWLLAALYQRRMLALMRTGAAPELASASATTHTTLAVLPATVRRSAWSPAIDFAANRRAGTWMLLSLGAGSLLVALTQSWLALLFVYTNRELTLSRVLVLGAIYAWPAVLVWGLARRWTWRRILGGVAGYLLAMLALVMFRSTAAQTLASVSGWLASQVAVPVTITLLIGASGRIRAVAPYLLPPTLLLTGSTVLALQIMAQRVANPAPWVLSLIEALGAYPVLLLFAVGPWLIVAWPVARLSRWLARAYRAKHFSDLGYLVATYWFLILFASALPALESVGWQAFIQLLAWLWLPVLLVALRQPLTPPPGPPTLLVLRVFQRDAQVEQLFDQVIERWRLTGNSVLIAGTDLLSRTLDPDDLFIFLDGALAERFIANPAQLAERIAGFDWQPDPDGRYRVNECYCFDSTWQPALRALVAGCDVVLMDLRGFRPNNQGCRFELRVLAAASHLRRVVILHDRDTARDTAEAEIAAGVNAAAADRFYWLAADHIDHTLASEILAALFDRVR